MVRATGSTICLAVLCAAAFAAPPAPASGPASAGVERIVFPADAAVMDAKRDFGAKGDGVSDDVEAIQKALDASTAEGRTRVLYLPNGVYRVSRGLVYKSPLGPWLCGETRDGVVIRLDDGAKDVTAVLRTHPQESGKTSSDWFMRNIRNLTIDIGDNPGVDGIRYYATNTGIIRDVTVRGRGKVGINSSFLGNNGPNLVQDALVDGPETGISCTWVYGQTLSRVTIRNCGKQGIVVAANSVAIESLVVENTPVALSCEIPKGWGHWGGVVALVGASLSGSGEGEGSAIMNQSILYARDVRTTGYKLAIQSKSPGGDVPGGMVKEYVSHPVRRAWPDSSQAAICLPIKPDPRVHWEVDPRQWVCVDDYGAVAGDNKDDTAAFQKAIDAAAAAGKTTVYIRGVGLKEPNWYSIDGDVEVRGSVRHIIGLGWGRILSGKSGGRFVVAEDAAPFVKFQNIDAFGGKPVVVENRSRSRTMLVESCGVDVVGDGQGDIFVTDCSAGGVELRKAGQSLWARHLNPEGSREGGLVRNNGGALWVMGTKSEGNGGIRYSTRDGGRTEVFGMFQYTSVSIAKDDVRPLFQTVDASLCVMGLREICHSGNAYGVKASEVRRGAERTLTNKTESGWTGWALYSGWRDPNAPNIATQPAGQ